MSQIKEILKDALHIKKIFFFALLYAPAAFSESIKNILDSITGGTGDFEVKNSIVGGAKDSVLGSGQLFLLAISIIAFLWVSYSAIAKFRECQSGRADWGELLVLGVAGAALLVFVAALLSRAAVILESSSP